MQYSNLNDCNSRMLWTTPKFGLVLKKTVKIIAEVKALKK